MSKLDPFPFLSLASLELHKLLNPLNLIGLRKIWGAWKIDDGGNGPSFLPLYPCYFPFTYSQVVGATCLSMPINNNMGSEKENK